MKKIIFSFIVILALASTFASAQSKKKGAAHDFEAYIINLIKADWVLHNTRLKYVNSHDEDQTISVEEMKRKYAYFIESVCKQHKDSMCLLVKDTTFIKVIKPYEADYTLYNKLVNKELCFIPYSKVKRKAIHGFITKNSITDEQFEKLYEAYGIEFDNSDKQKKRRGASR